MQICETNPIKLVIADEHHLFLEGIKSLLKRYKHIEIKGHAYDGAELIKNVRREVPDVVLTGIRMPLMNGIEATTHIKREFSSTEVIGIFLCEEDMYLLDMLKAGARGVLLKDTSAKELTCAIHAVYNKKVYCSEEATTKIAQLMNEKTIRSRTVDKASVLSEKEKLIIHLICQEYSTKQIADYLRLSSRSVESTKERMMEKIGARNMVGIAVYAFKHGFYPWKSDATS